MIVRTDAVVLHAFDYGETSRIAHLFTRQHGRVSVLARGARRPTSRFGSTLQPMRVVQAVYYRKPGRELQTLSEATHLHLLPRIGNDVERLATGLRLVELVRTYTEPEDPHPLLFARLVEALVRLDAGGPHTGNVLPHFQLQLAAALGFAPDVRKADVQALPEEGGALDLARGAVEAAATGTDHRRASRSALRAFAILARTDLETALRLRLSPAQRDEVLHLTEAYLDHHLEGRAPSRVQSVARQLLRADPPA